MYREKERAVLTNTYVDIRASRASFLQNAVEFSTLTLSANPTLSKETSLYFCIKLDF